MDNLSFLLGLNANNGGGTASTPTWSEVEDKPFETVGTGLTVTAGALQATGSATVDWDDIQDKPTFASVATTGDYDDLTNKPTIPAQTQVTVVQGLTTGVVVGDIDVNGVTTTLYAPQGGGTAVTPNWNATSGQDGYIENKPSISAGTGNNSIVEGNLTGSLANVASSPYAHAEGYHTTASKDYAHAEGYETTASGSTSHAEGENTTASSDASHAEGRNTSARQKWAHAEGDNTEAIAVRAHAEGLYTRANSANQHVQGKYNVLDPQPSTNAIGLYADIIGNGTADNSRSNAEATDWLGNKYLAGDVYTQVTNWGTTPTIGAKKLEPVSITNTLSSGTAIADIDIGGVTTTLYAPAGGGSVPFSSIGNGLTITAGGALQEEVPIYSEIVTSSLNGLLLNGPVSAGDADFDIEHNMPSNSYLQFTESEDAYTVMADIDGTVYSGIWNSNPDGDHAHGSYTSWHITSPINSYWELYINNEEEIYRQRFHIYPDGMECEVLNWLFIIPNDPENEQYITEANVESYNYTWGSQPHTETVYHRLPLVYAPIEAGNFLYNDNGTIKSYDLNPNGNVYISKDEQNHVYNIEAIASNFGMKLIRSEVGELHAEYDNYWYNMITDARDAQKIVYIWVDDTDVTGNIYCLYYDKSYTSNNTDYIRFSNPSLVLDLTQSTWSLSGDITDSGTDWYTTP